MNDLILETNCLRKVFHGKREALAVDGVSLQIRKGEFFGLIGESGSGKSTVANLAAGLLKPTAGHVHFYGRQMQMVFQNPMMSFSPRMQILDSICEGLHYKTDLSKAEIRKKALEAMDMVQLSRSYANRYSRQLSGGECQRAAIARAILIRPELLICDEVTSALDVSVQAQIIELLCGFKKELGLSCLFISHDIALVSGICDKTAVMYQGQIVEEGETSDVVFRSRNEYTKALIHSALTVDSHMADSAGLIRRE